MSDDINQQQEGETGAWGRLEGVGSRKRHPNRDCGSKQVLATEQGQQSQSTRQLAKKT